ncbi:MAG: arylsulfatase [Planctomycetota bacterium]
MAARALAVATLVALLAGAARAQAPQRPPNIVFVLADDLGYGELGCFGQQKIATPHIDTLAKQGMRLTQHYAGSPVCAPSRCVLMTGKHPGHAAVRDNQEAKPEGQWPLPKGETTLGEVLHAAGYTSGGYGKWGLGMLGTTGDPLQRGFDHFFGYNCQRHAHSYWPSYLWDDDHRIALANDPPVPGGGKLAADADPNDAKSYASFRGTDYAPDRILAAAVKFVRDNKDRPFFLYFPSTLPHLALHAKDADLAAYAGKFDETPYTGKNGYTPTPTPRAAYAAMIHHLDADVGALTSLLDELGLREHTIVVFTSDNGATHSPVGGTDCDFFASCGPLRGRKGSMYEGGIRVPGIVRWPGHVRQGSDSDFRCGFEDWLPTFAALAGARAPAGIDGIDLTPLLEGKAPPPRAFFYREFAGYGGWQAVWVGSEKLIRKNLQKGPIAVELYDLAADLGETRNLAGDRPERVRELAAMIASQHVPSATFPLAQVDGK